MHDRPPPLRVAILVLLGAMACGAAPARAQPPLLGALVAESGAPDAAWRFAGLPRQPPPPTRFAAAELDGRRVLRIEADGSYGNLVHAVGRRLPPGARLSWRWRVDALLPGADLRTRAGDDAALKVCVMFDLPLDKVPFVERQLLRLARSRSAQPLPSATLCYVWDTLPSDGDGEPIPNAYTARVRTLVLQGGGPGRWTSENRDIGADFRRAFGAESTEVPPVQAIGVGADADNTRGHSVGFVADLELRP